jgi:hypothetical protein
MLFWKKRLNDVVVAVVVVVAADVVVAQVLINCEWNCDETATTPMGCLTFIY